MSAMLVSTSSTCSGHTTPHLVRASPGFCVDALALYFFRSRHPITLSHVFGSAFTGTKLRFSSAWRLEAEVVLLSGASHHIVVLLRCWLFASAAVNFSRSASNQGRSLAVFDRSSCGRLTRVQLGDEEAKLVADYVLVTTFTQVQCGVLRSFTGRAS